MDWGSIMAKFLISEFLSVIVNSIGNEVIEFNGDRCIITLISFIQV